MIFKTALLVVAVVATAGFNVTAASAQNPPVDTHHDQTTDQSSRDMHRDMHQDMHRDMHRDMHHNWNGHRHCMMRWHHHHHVRVCR